MRSSAVLVASSAAVLAVAAQKPTYYWGSIPDQTEQGQTGTNDCGTTNSQSSECQTLVVNSIEDFCVWGPPTMDSSIGDTEQIEVAWCTKQGRGARTIPSGTIQGAHFVQTPDFIQITGVGDFTQIGINAVGGGGELDPHGADGMGNPHGALVFTSAFGNGMQQAHEWTNFMSDSEFCIRVCKDGPNAWLYCNHIYDVMGCEWNMPGNYDAGSFDTCAADSGTPMGLYPSGNNAWGSTFHQGDAATPSGHPAPASSNCQNFGSITGGSAAAVTSVASTANPSSSVAKITSTSTSTSSKPSSSSVVSTSTTVVSTTVKSTSTMSSSSATAVTSSVRSSSSSSSSAGSGGAAGANANQAQPTTSAKSGASQVGASLVGLAGAALAMFALV